jgi:polyhydroxyalkanoate synthesis regulator protein
MDSFTDEAPAEATGEGKTASPESDLDELREQIKALQAEMGALKRGGQG